MKSWLMFLFLLSFVSASVDVHNYSVESMYSPFDKITGSVNLTIVGEDSNEKIFLSNGSEIMLGDFLERSGSEFDCSPTDCLTGYSSVSPETNKTISLQLSQEQYLGFVLTGNNIVLNSIDFKVASDFGEEYQLPLVVEFFEDKQWKFEEFSDNFLGRDWGCFDPTSGSAGSLIGPSPYCERVTIRDNGKLWIGADVVDGEGELDMTISPVDEFGGGWSCSFDPSVDYGCEVAELGDVISGGDYNVCVGASVPTYNIYEESVGDNCGFFSGVSNSVPSVKDYAIFVQEIKYANASFVSDLTFDEEYIESANAYISERYDGDCSEGCILPLKISGVSQNFNIYDVALSYNDNTGYHLNDLVYGLDTSPAKIDFDGTLDLSLLGIGVPKAGEYFASFLGEDLFRENITLFTVPIIHSVSPLNPSVGVSVSFYADVDFEGNATLNYKWDFGDGKKAQTNVPSVLHMYNDLGNYTLSLEVIPGGDLTLGSVGNFNVETISPEAAVIDGLLSKETFLTNARSEIEGFSAWYVNDLLELLNIVNFEKELARLQKEYDDSFDTQDLVTVMNGLYALDVPVGVFGKSFESSFLIPDAQGIDINPVVAISGEDVSGASEDYANSILAWQEENVDVSVQLRHIFGSYLDKEDVDILSAYTFDITSRGEGESYFVIGMPLNELHFNSDVGAKEAGSSTVIVLDKGVKKTIEFYYMGVESTSFFVSPKLSSFVIEADIVGSCNFNRFCEKSLGEDSNSCRSDCKPVKKAIWFFIIGLIVFLAVYTGLQIWYKKHYEAYLFKDNLEMYNLLMYVTNARTRGLKDKKISSELKSKGWSSEKVNYIIRKSAGKSVGMIEIIPIEFISSLLRKRKAKNIKGATTPVPQQNNANINKSRVQV